MTICGYNKTVEYEWDENKRLTNIIKHGFDFIKAEQVLQGKNLAWKLEHREEVRFAAVGKIDDTIVTIIYTMRHDKYRIISIRRA